MLPSEELLQSIDILAQNAVKDSVKIYTAIVISVANDNTCSVKVNGKTHSGVTYYGATPSVNKSYRVFCPNGSMNQAFIITGGGSLPIASADVLGGIKVGAGLTISSEGTLSATGGGTADAVEWSNVLDKPSTISGYGITDARISGNTITLGSQTMTPYTANNTPPYPVTSVNGQTGDITIATGGNVDSVNGKTGTVVLTASDVGALSADTAIPSKTSQLENDSGYITSSALSGYAKTSDIPTETSQLQNNSGFITADDVPVKSVDGATGAVVTNAVKTTTQSLTETQKQQARTNIGAGTSSFDGDYNSLSNTPTIPTKTSDITNDSGYITSNDAPVKSVNGQTGAIVLNAEDVGALPDSTIIPSKTSQLDNDSGFISNFPIASATQLGGIKVGAGLAINTSGILSATGGGTADAVEWNNVLDRPSTIDGYGITDAKINNGTITLGVNSITPYTSMNPQPIRYPVTSVNGMTGDVIIQDTGVKFVISTEAPVNQSSGDCWYHITGIADV